jgi:hypothetical protein
LSQEGEADSQKPNAVAESLHTGSPSESAALSVAATPGKAYNRLRYYTTQLTLVLF